VDMYLERDNQEMYAETWKIGPLKCQSRSDNNINIHPKELRFISIFLMD
jgi:hypothetical protein